MDGAQVPKNPASFARRKGVVLALASACVFSVAVIGHTHPPFPAPKVRRRDEATDALTLISRAAKHPPPMAYGPVVVGALAALSFIRRSEDAHLHLK